MSDKIYPKGYVPSAEPVKPTVSAAKKKAALDKLKAHMIANPRGYYKKELMEFVHHELVSGNNIHMPDKEIAAWIDEINDKWAWHPPEVEPVEIEGKKP